VVAADKPAGFGGKTGISSGDLAAPGAAEKLVGDRPDVIFHLAGVVSGEAETDFDKGYHVNLDGTRALLEDYTRRNILDGVGIRLPTICVRPGKPNKAASGFFSGIIREPLAGQEAL